MDRDLIDLCFLKIGMQVIPLDTSTRSGMIKGKK
jgi:hypothetical protein